MSYPTFLIEKKDLEGGLVHPKGTLLLKLSGNNAMKSSIGSLLEALKLSAAEVTALYRFENPYTWFLVPTTAKVRDRLVGKSFGSETSFKVEIFPIEEERLKITLHWVSPSIAKTKIVEIIETFAEQGSKVEVTKIGASDKWVSFIKAKKDAPIPHYIQLRYEGDPKIYKVLVTIPGRRQQCLHCGLDQHWSNQCPTRKAGPARTVPPKEKPGPLSYAQAVKEGNPKEKEIEKWLQKDGFTIVEKGKKGVFKVSPKKISKVSDVAASSMMADAATSSVVASTPEIAVDAEVETPQSVEDFKLKKRFRSKEHVRSAPGSPTKLKRKRCLSVSSCEDLFASPRIIREVVSPPNTSLDVSALDIPETPPTLVIDEGGTPIINH